ncbi:MAG: translocation/assembly module TamB domain-containing protein [Candidatus Omnitrophota bacterium]
MVKRFIIILFSLAVLLSAAVAYVTLTASGSQWMVRTILRRVLDYDREDFLYEESSGTLVSGLSFKNMEIRDIPFMPEGGILRIQELTADINGWGWDDVDIRVDNARWSLPRESGLAVGFFTLQQGKIDANVFSEGLNISGLLKLFARDKAVFYDGWATDIDLYAQGDLEQLNITGEFTVESLRRGPFTLEGARCTADLKIMNVMKDDLVRGNLRLVGGRVYGQRTAKVEIEEVLITSPGNIRDAYVNFEGKAVIDQVRVVIIVNGTLQDPQVTLSSTPILSQQQLLLMVMTNKRWFADSAVGEGQGIPAEAAKDFIDYFVFGGAGSRIAERYGITRFDIIYEEGRRGLNVSKEVGGGLEAQYGIEQDIGDEEAGEVTHTVGGEYRLTDKLSVQGEKEFLPAQDKTDSQTESEGEGKVLLKYRTKF